MSFLDRLLISTLKGFIIILLIPLLVAILSIIFEMILGIDILRTAIQPYFRELLGL